MASATGLKRVRFEVPLEQGAFAVQLRLTPHLLEALLGAQDAAQAGSIRFGDDTAGNVGAGAATAKTACRCLVCLGLAV